MAALSSLRTQHYAVVDMAVLWAVDSDELSDVEEILESLEVEDIEDVEVIDTRLVIAAAAFFLLFLRAFAHEAGSIDTI